MPMPVQLQHKGLALHCMPLVRFAMLLAGNTCWKWLVLETSGSQAGWPLSIDSTCAVVVGG